MKTRLGLLVVVPLLSGCLVTSQSYRHGNNIHPRDLCTKKGGSVETVNNGAEVFCQLPDGSIYELSELYQKYR